eukprot:TRINITY_DN2603_c0_g4_i1.p1 TRINITY_DN2603_c0_g4~~TRINITY_DN2603_c0_g4_i1.p1  ORF type:complete len:470 (+),score=104.00 TRINITY_DN2603_c0_g4_i1:96-1412(+)
MTQQIAQLHQELAGAVCAASTSRAQCDILQEQCLELSAQLARERAEHSLRASSPRASPARPASGAPMSPSRPPATAADYSSLPPPLPPPPAPAEPPQCRSSSPPRSPRRGRGTVPPSGAQLATWRDFVAAARRFRLTERDLLLVSAGTLRQLVTHCGFGGHPVDVARIELQWRHLNESGMSCYDTVQQLPVPPPPPPAALPAPAPPPARLRTPSPAAAARSRTASARRSAAASAPCGDDSPRDFDLDFVPRKKPSLSRRSPLLQRACSAADPNLMVPRPAAHTGRRSASPERLRGGPALPPYDRPGGRGLSPQSRGGLHTAPYGERTQPTFDRCQNHGPAQSETRERAPLRPTGRRSPSAETRAAHTAGSNPNNITAGRPGFPPRRRAAAASPESRYIKISETAPYGTDYGCGKRLVPHRAKCSGTGELLAHQNMRPH